MGFAMYHLIGVATIIEKVWIDPNFAWHCATFILVILMFFFTSASSISSKNKIFSNVDKNLCDNLVMLPGTDTSSNNASDLCTCCTLIHQFLFWKTPWKTHSFSFYLHIWIRFQWSLKDTYTKKTQLCWYTAHWRHNCEFFSRTRRYLKRKRKSLTSKLSWNNHST